jgi:hypothetical protein
MPRRKKGLGGSRRQRSGTMSSTANAITESLASTISVMKRKSCPLGPTENDGWRMPFAKIVEPLIVIAGAIERHVQLSSALAGVGTVRRPSHPALRWRMTAMAVRRRQPRAPGEQWRAASCRQRSYRAHSRSGAFQARFSSDAPEIRSWVQVPIDAPLQLITFGRQGRILSSCFLDTTRSRRNYHPELHGYPLV